MARRGLIRLGLLSPPSNMLRNADFRSATTPGFPDYWGSSAATAFEDASNLLAVEEGSPVPNTRVVALHNSRSDYVFEYQAYNAAYDVNVPFHENLVFSVWLRSDREGFRAALEINDDGKHEVTVGKTWRREFITLARPPHSSSEHSLWASVSLLERGRLWMAAPQLETGKEPSQFRTTLMDDHPVPVWPWKAVDETVALARAAPDTTPTLSFVAIFLDQAELRQLKDIAAHGFNGIVPFGRLEVAPLRRCLDVAEKVGLRVVPLLDHALKAPFREIAARTLDRVQALRDHPALFAWIVVDEPARWWDTAAGRTRDDLTSLVQAVRATDPRHPACVNDQANEWQGNGTGYLPLDAAEIVSCDDYPIGHFQNGVAHVGDSSGNLTRNTAGKLAAFWLQLHGGASVQTREPTVDEVRAMTWVAFVRGVRWRFYWYYKPMNPTLWASMAPLNAEIDRLGKLVLGPDARPLARGTRGGKIHYAAWRLVGPGGKRCLAACNASEETLSVRFDTQEWGLEPARVPRGQSDAQPVQLVDAWYGREGIETEGRSLRVRFGPLERRVLIWTGA
ncbi:MAG: hypothetical protein FJX76_03300 [Armatimonadetes bacterium]|nr:hypothetical protein [Armatimonadota bacterium]